MSKWHGYFLDHPLCSRWKLPTANLCVSASCHLIHFWDPGRNPQTESIFPLMALMSQGSLGCPEESHSPTLGKLGHKSISHGMGMWTRGRGLAAPAHLPGLILKEGLLVAWPESDAHPFTCNPDCDNPDDGGGACSSQICAVHLGAG